MRLVVSDLACRRGGRLVLSGFGAEIGPGEALLVTGRNGAGKSTLLATIAGSLRPESGRIALEGAGERTITECLHLVAHRDGLKGALSAAENLAFAADLLDGRDETPEAALRAVGLAGAGALPVAYLSAGQRRRVGLARLRVARRPIWLLDEPTTALDRDGVAIALRMMEAHLAGGGLLVAATHLPLPLPGAREIVLGEARAR